VLLILSHSIIFTGGHEVVYRAIYAHFRFYLIACGKNEAGRYAVTDKHFSGEKCLSKAVRREGDSILTESVSVVAVFTPLRQAQGP
jgi:hypothetical protein